MSKVFCTNCGNAVSKSESVCIYCQVPLSKSIPQSSSRTKLILRILIPIFILGALVQVFPTIVKLFRGEPQKVSEPPKEPASAVTSTQPISQGVQDGKEPSTGEDSALAAYKNLVKAIERSDEKTARRYVANARWNEMELEKENPSAVDELDAQCSVETKFASHDRDDRSILIASGKSTLVNGDDGKPALKVLIVKMAKEEDQWKVFSIECHHKPPVDYMEAPLGWLYERPSLADDLNSKLLANGLRYGEQSCFMAVDIGNARAVSKCLDAGWSFNAENSDGRKAIDLALEKIEYASAGNNEVLMLFIKEGANINRANDQGMTPLMFAAMHCNADIAKDLLDACADINYKTPDGISPFTLAENCPEVTKLLRASKPQ